MRMQMRLQLLSIFVCLLLIIGCVTQDGVLIQPDPGSIKVVSPQDASLFIDGKRSGSTQNGSLLVTDVPIGEKIITIFAEGYKLVKDTLSLTSGELIKITPAFEVSSSGNLTVNSDSTASVTIDNLEVGVVDSLGQFTLTGFPVGMYNVFIQSGSKSLDTTISISDGKTTNLNAYLTLRQQVLIEHVSNVSCEVCPEYAEVLYHVLDSLNWNNISKISYSANWPATDDPFYIYNPTPQLDRAMLYGPELNYALPFFVINGIPLQFDASDEKLAGLLATSITSELEIEPTIQLDVTESSVKITSLLDSTFTGTLRVNLVEDIVTFEEAPGKNGETEFLNAFRKLLLDETVTINSGETLTENFTLDIGDLSRSNLRLTVFLQDSDNRVLQTTDKQL